MIELPADVARLAARQHGRLTRRQILARVSSNRMRKLLAAGVLVGTERRGVYRVAGAQQTRYAELAEVLLRLGRGAAADGVTALALHGVPPLQLAPPYHAVVPTDRRVRNAGCTVRRVDLAECERTTVAGLACATPARAVLPLARDGLDAKVRHSTVKTLKKGVTARATIDELLRLGLDSHDGLLATALAHPTDPGAAALRRGLADGTFKQENDAERRLAKLFRPGDPQPQWQVWVLPDVRVDGALLEARVALEYNSRRWHLQPGDQDRDGSRSLRLASAGIVVITVTAGMLRDEREQTRQRILQTYAQQVADGVEPLVPCEPPTWAT
jgi:hypothetical protein